MGLVNFGVGVGLAPENDVIISTSVDVFDDSGFNIGFLTSLNRNDTRDTQEVRHFDSADAGRILEQAPGVERYSLTASGWALYDRSITDKRSLLNRLPQGVVGSRTFRVLNDQKIPFALQEEETHPGSGIKTTVFYLGCYLTSFSKPIAIGTATITENCNIKPSWVQDLPA